MDSDVKVLPEIEDEVDVVKAIYGEDAVRLLRGRDPNTVALEVSLHPRVEQGAALVSATVSLSLPAGYPCTAEPQVSVERSRGLSDSSLAKLLQAAKVAVASHGLAEDGCVCQLLAEMSEALDAANDESECNICLSPCGGASDGSVVHAPCHHVYHAGCLSRWAAIKAAEAQAAAGDAMRSAVAQRDALLRDVAEAEVKVQEMALQAVKAKDLLANCTRLRDASRRLHCGAGDDEDDEELPNLADEDGQVPSLIEFEARLMSAKGALKGILTDERRSQARRVDVDRQLGVLEDDLAATAAGVGSAGLPCPVCREPIDCSLHPPLNSGSVAGPLEGSLGASVDSLPKELREYTRTLQRQHAGLLARRAVAELSEEQPILPVEHAGSSSSQSAAPVGSTPLPRSTRGESSLGSTAFFAAPARSQGRKGKGRGNPVHEATEGVGSWDESGWSGGWTIGWSGGAGWTEASWGSGTASASSGAATTLAQDDGSGSAGGRWRRHKA